MPQVVEIPGLSKAEAEERAANFSIDAVQVDTIREADGTFTVRATYPDGIVVPGATPSAPPPETGTAQPPAGGPEIVDEESGGFSIKGLTREAADEEAAFFDDAGSTVEVVAEGDTFTVHVAPLAPQPAPAPAPPVSAAPDLDGYVLCLDRIRTERRPGKAFDRTVSRYQAYFNRAPVAGISGMAVERQGPSDNSSTGVSQHRRIEAGTYPLFTHAGANIKYRTIGYLSPPNYPKRPWPCLGVEHTGSRTGILIHCAAGYLMSIGCINLTANIVNEQTNVVFSDSWLRVTALIESIRSHLGATFPAHNNAPLQNTRLVIRE